MKLLKLFLLVSVLLPQIGFSEEINGQIDTGSQCICKDPWDAGYTGGGGGCCQTNSDCTGGNVCISGNCGPCTASFQCDAGKACIAGECSNCVTDSQCAYGQKCVGGICGGCNSSTECAGGLACIDGVCQGCVYDDHCSNGQLCEYDFATGIKKCMCSSDEQCPSGTPCLYGTCGCADNSQCNGKVCDTVSHTCEYCTNNEQCDDGLVCNLELGQCVGCTPWGDECGDKVCLGGSCQSCTLDIQCKNGDVCNHVTGECVNLCSGSDPLCGAGETCNYELGYCEDSCTSNADCGPGETCSSHGYCTDQPIACSGCGQSNCPNGYTCYDDKCKRECDTSKDCPGDLACVDDVDECGNGVKICGKECNIPEDCNSPLCFTSMGGSCGVSNCVGGMCRGCGNSDSKHQNCNGGGGWRCETNAMDLLYRKCVKDCPVDLVTDLAEVSSDPNNQSLSDPMPHLLPTTKVGPDVFDWPEERFFAPARIKGWKPGHLECDYEPVPLTPGMNITQEPQWMPSGYFECYQLIDVNYAEPGKFGTMCTDCYRNWTDECINMPHVQGPPDQDVTVWSNRAGLLKINSEDQTFMHQSCQCSFHPMRSGGGDQINSSSATPNALPQTSTKRK